MFYLVVRIIVKIVVQVHVNRTYSTQWFAYGHSDFMGKVRFEQGTS